MRRKGAGWGGRRLRRRIGVCGILSIYGPSQGKRWDGGRNTEGKDRGWDVMEGMVKGKGWRV